jgi:exosortase/archaeosortase family protein
MLPRPSINRQLASALTQHRLAVATKFTFIATVVFAFYFQDLNLVFRNALSDEATYHILLIPFLFGYLLYRKRKMVGASFSQDNQNQSSNIIGYFTPIMGVLLCTVAFLVYWFGSYTFTPIEYHMLTLPILASGLILVLFNGQTLKHLAFPIAFLFFLMPPPTEILYSVGSTLSDLSAHASNAIVNAFGVSSAISAQYGSPIITITRANQTIMNFSIDVACSGVYSLIGFLIFAVFIAYITRGRLWNKGAILALGIPLIVALNIIRITAILAIGNAYGDELALQVFHALGATVLMFIGTLILLVTTDRIIKKPKNSQPCLTCSSKQPQSFCSGCGKIFNQTKTRLRKMDLAKIFGITVIVALLLSIQAPVFALTEGPAQVLIQTPSGLQPNIQTLPLPQIEGYNLSYVYRDTSFEKLSGEDASLVYAYGSSDLDVQTVWVSVELASTTGPLHRWETCLINYPISQGLQPKVTQLDLSDIQTQSNPPIVGRYFAFQYRSTNQTQVVLYWYETATFNVDNQTQQKHVKISLVVYPNSVDEIEQSEALLLPIAKQINDFWQPIKSWTTVALTISRNGLALSGVAVVLIVVLIFYRLIFMQREKRSLVILFNKLPASKQQLVSAVEASANAGTPTTEGIAAQLAKPVDVEHLNVELECVQSMGLIQRMLVNKEDKPAYLWKSLLPQRGILRSLPFISRFLYS